MKQTRMGFDEFRESVAADLFRVTGQRSTNSFAKQLVVGEGFKYLFWLRLCRFTHDAPLLRFLIFPLARFYLWRLHYHLGVTIPWQAQIEPGLYVGHFGGIVVHPRAVIGRNCNISQNVTIGQANRGRNAGSPIIGKQVYLGPGAKVVGAVRIGDRAAVGANAVVTRDVPDDAVVVGAPARVISLEGSAGYINRLT